MELFLGNPRWSPILDDRATKECAQYEGKNAPFGPNGRVAKEWAQDDDGVDGGRGDEEDSQRALLLPQQPPSHDPGENLKEEAQARDRNWLSEMLRGKNSP